MVFGARSSAGFNEAKGGAIIRASRTTRRVYPRLSSIFQTHTYTETGEKPPLTTGPRPRIKANPVDTIASSVTYARARASLSADARNRAEFAITSPIMQLTLQSPVTHNDTSLCIRVSSNPRAFLATLTDGHCGLSYYRIRPDTWPGNRFTRNLVNRFVCPSWISRHRV